MAIAESFAGDYNKVHYYQGVLIVEVALTLILYLILKIIHYIKWGHDEQAAKDESAPKPAEEETESRVIILSLRNGIRKVGMFIFPSYLLSILEQSH